MHSSWMGCLDRQSIFLNNGYHKQLNYENLNENMKFFLY